jgi:hypothetical protein
MSEIEIVIAAAGGQRHADVFTAHWGDIVLTTSRTTFFDSARKLLEIGAEPTDLLIMRHQRSSTRSLRPDRGGSQAGGHRHQGWSPIRSVGGPERDLGEDQG